MGILEKDKHKRKDETPLIFPLIQWNVKRGMQRFGEQE